MIQDVVIGMLFMAIVVLWLGMNKMHKRMVNAEEQLVHYHKVELETLHMLDGISTVLLELTRFHVKHQQQNIPKGEDITWKN